MDKLNLQAFLEEITELFSELEAALLELEHSPDDGDLIGRVFRAMHTIKGNSSMFGYERVAAYTHDLEAVYDQVRNGSLPVTRKLIDLTLKAIDFVREELAGGDATRFVDERRGQELIASLQQITPVCSETVHEAAPPVGSISISHFIPMLTEYEMGRLRANLGKGRRVYSCRVTVSFGTFDQELESLAGRLKEDGELLSKIPFMDGVAEGSIGLRILFASSQEPALLNEIAEISPEAVDCRDIPAVKAVGKLIEPECTKVAGNEKQMQADDVLVEVDLASTCDDAPELAGRQSAIELRKERQAQKEVDNIHVPTEKLDRLVNLVGEFVTVQARLMQRAVIDDDAELETVAEDMERLTAELRDIAITIRMLPIGTVFGRLRRLMHNVAAELEKEAELITAGEDTELDKSVIERLGEPLEHLVRYITVHSIEPPAERMVLGKPCRGTIHVAAINTGECIQLTITDDGGGLDREAIRANAVEKGLISPDVELPDKDLFNLIFFAGVWTNQWSAVDHGCTGGMEMVKRGIDLLQGTIEVGSSPGIGTLFTVRIPLSLTIMQSLLVKVGDNRFVIPLKIVDECVELIRQDSETADSQRMVEVRGHMVPCVPLREKFSVSGIAPRIQQVLISEVEGNRVGLVIDHVIGEHQAVIKSLGKMFHGVRGLSGATILGDGGVAMILDVPDLLRSTC